MKIKRLAILIACHKNPFQVNKLVKCLEHDEIDVFLHIDKKSKMRSEIQDAKNLYILPEECSVDVEWAKISQVDAIINLMSFSSKTNQYRYYIYISGEDYPCKSLEEILNLVDLQEDRFLFWNSYNIDGKINHYDKRNSLYFPKWIIGRNIVQKTLKRIYIELTGGYNKLFIKRRNVLNCKFYFGSSWWGMTSRTLDWMLEYLDGHPEFYKYYSNCMNPDESFFQTLFMLSPYGTLDTDYLTYLKFLPKKEGSKYTKNSPEYLDENDIEKAKRSKYYFMRKINLTDKNNTAIR